MTFKEMNPEDVWKALEGHVDVLSGMARLDLHREAQTCCPRCQEKSVTFSVNPHRPFSRGQPLPNKIARCSSCGTEFDPASGIITKTTDERG